MWQELRGWRRGLPVSGSRAMIGQAIRHMQAVVTVEMLALLPLTICAMIVLLLARILSK